MLFLDGLLLARDGHQVEAAHLRDDRCVDIENGGQLSQVREPHPARFLLIPTRSGWTGSRPSRTQVRIVCSCRRATREASVMLSQRSSGPANSVTWRSFCPAAETGCSSGA